MNTRMKLIPNLTAAAITAFAVCMLMPAGAARADDAAEINAKVDEALKGLHTEVKGSDAVTSAAKGVLVFAGVFKAGVGIGGEYGEGALRIAGKTADYYSIGSASIGLQLGAQKKDVVICFMDQRPSTPSARSTGWKAGVDGRVALITLGTGGSLDTATIKEPIVGFVVGHKGRVQPDARRLEDLEVSASQKVEAAAVTPTPARAGFGRVYMGLQGS